MPLPRFITTKPTAAGYSVTINNYVLPGLASLPREAAEEIRDSIHEILLKHGYEATGPTRRRG